jgi:hypothetical protein
MKPKKIWLVMAIVFVLCVIAQPVLATSVIHVEPSHVNIPSGGNFTVNITVDPAGNEVYSVSYTLYFDNTLLNAISWTQGEFLTRDGNSSNVWTHKINNTLGKFEYAEGRMGAAVGVGGDPGNLTTITFQAIGNEGVSLLEIGDLAGGLLVDSTSGPISTDISNGTCKIEDITPTSTPTTSPTTTVTTTPVQTPTTIPITPTPAATAIQTPTILSTPSPSPTTITSPISPTAPISPPKEKSEENNRLPGFRAAFAITWLLAVFILKRKDVRK